MKYTYTDFITRKPRFTRGRFSHWQRGGPLNVFGAVFQNRTSILFIPRYLLTPESIQALPPIVETDQQAVELAAAFFA